MLIHRLNKFLFEPNAAYPNIIYFKYYFWMLSKYDYLLKIIKKMWNMNKYAKH